MDVDPRIGTTVQGRYRILERMAGGAMGVVYRAERVELGRQVAIKFLHPMFAASKELITRFEREARTMSRLDHPHCVSVIDLGVAEAGPFIVMDFVTGTTLLQLLEEGPLLPARALGIMQQVLAGLAHAHERGVIHRDVKPANVMLTNPTGTGDHVRILDFGLAKLADVDQSVSGVIAGTPSYMSPEQARGGKLDARTDIYSSGVLLFQLMTGEKPFDSDQAIELLRMQVQDPPPTLASLHPRGAFSAELEQVVARALAKSPDERYQTADAMATALAAVPEAASSRRATAPSRPLSPELPAPAPAPAASPRPSPSPPSRSPSARRLPWRLIAALATLAAVIAFVAFTATGKRWAGKVEEKTKSIAGGDDTTTGKPAAPAVKSVADAEALARTDRDAAIAALHDLRRKTPGDARIPRLMGRLYADKSWWSESLLSYREALDKNRAYRTDAAVIDGIIRTLGEPAQHDLAAATLKSIGKPAIPRLRAAAREHRVPSVRAAAKKLLPALGA